MNHDCEEVSLTVDAMQFDEEGSPYHWRSFQSGEESEYVG